MTQNERPATHAHSRGNQTQITSVKVVDFDMSIGSLIGLFIKMAIASIPAMIILWFFSTLLFALVAMVFGVGGGLFG